MFRFKSIIGILFLISCGSPKENVVKSNKIDCTRVINKTDSILSYADDKIVQIKQNKVNQRLFVDSLKHTIEVEQNIINKLNEQVHIKEVIVANNQDSIEITKQQLEEALLLCREKEKELKQLNEQFALKSEKFLSEIEYYVDREIKLITSYNHKVDSLTKIIQSMNQSLNTNKKKKRRNR